LFLLVRSFCYGFAAQRFVRLPTTSCLPPSLQRGPAEAAPAFAAEEATGSQAGPLRMLIGAALPEVADLKQGGFEGWRALVRFRVRRQLVAMKQLNCAARQAAQLALEGSSFGRAQTKNPSRNAGRDVLLAVSD